MDSTLQSRLHLWRQRNFPDSTAEDQLLGVVEEVGEVAHAVLKRKQRIRGLDHEHQEAELDAVGDIMVFLAGFCSYRNYDMLAIFERVGEEVAKRDWIKYPKDGHSE